MKALRDLSREELSQLWERTYGSAPSSGVRTELLLRSAAWHLQAKHLGGLSGEARRLLRSAIAEVEAKVLDRGRGKVIAGDGQETAPNVGSAVAEGTSIAPSGQSAAKSRRLRRLLPGARLMRNWNGRTHVVDVVDGGFRFEEKVYTSRSAIAETITGVHWSGPRLFGL